MRYRKGQIIPSELFTNSKDAIIKAIIDCEIEEGENNTLIITPLEVQHPNGIIYIRGGVINKTFFIKEYNVINKYRNIKQINLSKL